MMEMIKKVFHISMIIAAAILAFTLVSGPCATAMADDKGEAQSIVDKSKATLTDLMSDQNFSWLWQYIKKADAVVIFPQVIKGGFFIGGSGGTGVVLVRDRDAGTWSQPAFYTVGSVTFGLQIGGEAAEVVMLAMNRNAVDSLLNSSVKLGGDASIAIGPVGGGAKGSATVPDVTADFLSFTKAKGLYAGLNLEGSVLAVRDSLNEAYYGKAIAPREIIFGRKAFNRGADSLRKELQKATR